MNNRIARLVVVLLALAAAGGAGYYAFTLEQRAASRAASDLAFAEGAVRLQATLADLRASQAAYLAGGQDAAVWIEKVGRLKHEADAQVQQLVSAAGDDSLAAVTEGVASFERLDARVLERLRDQQPLTASSLIFSDAAQALSTTSLALGHTRGARAARGGAAIAALKQAQLYALAGGTAALVLALVLLLPTGGGRRDAPLEATEQPAANETTTTRTEEPEEYERRGLGLDFEGVRNPDKPWTLDFPPDLAQESRPTAAAPVQLPHSDEGAGAPAGQARPWGVDLSAAAQLCTDLARVHDTSELQELLSRAASLLDATGIVVWMGGVEADVLWPAFSYGYSPQALTRMQALPRDGATPVSVAFRKGLIQTVPAQPGNSGAVVTPILTANGCVGVMAVELRQGTDTSDNAEALASIVAAQLATLVAGEGGQTQ
jgi:hypothetical protein